MSGDDEKLQKLSWDEESVQLYDARRQLEAEREQMRNEQGIRPYRRPPQLELERITAAEFSHLPNFDPQRVWLTERQNVGSSRKVIDWQLRQDLRGGKAYLVIANATLEGWDGPDSFPGVNWPLITATVSNMMLRLVVAQGSLPAPRLDRHKESLAGGHVPPVPPVRAEENVRYTDYLENLGSGAGVFPRGEHLGRACAYGGRPEMLFVETRGERLTREDRRAYQDLYARLLLGELVW